MGLCTLPRKLGLNVLHEDLFDIEYSEPPIEGNRFITPITNGLTLFMEGVEQHHCVSFTMTGLPSVSTMFIKYSNLNEQH
jgi:hypothetical protein